MKEILETWVLYLCNKEDKEKYHFCIYEDGSGEIYWYDEISGLQVVRGYDVNRISYSDGSFSYSLTGLDTAARRVFAHVEDYTSFSSWKNAIRKLDEELDGY